MKAENKGNIDAILEQLPGWTFSKIPSFATSPEDDRRRCALCFDNFVPDISVLSLPCSHYFHATCLKSLLESNYKQMCPLCKTTICSHCYWQQVQMAVAGIERSHRIPSRVWQCSSTRSDAQRLLQHCSKRQHTHLEFGFVFYSFYFNPFSFLSN